jgi:hypothetical protein
MHGPPQRRLAARFVLDCLKGDHTKEEIAECLDDLHHQALLDVASEARALAVEYHLIA